MGAPVSEESGSRHESTVTRHCAEFSQRPDRLQPAESATEMVAEAGQPSPPKAAEDRAVLGVVGFLLPSWKWQ